MARSCLPVFLLPFLCERQTSSLFSAAVRWLSTVSVRSCTQRDSSGAATRAQLARHRFLAQTLLRSAKSATRPSHSKPVDCVRTPRRRSLQRARLRERFAHESQSNQLRALATLCLLPEATRGVEPRKEVSKQHIDTSRQLRQQEWLSAFSSQPSRWRTRSSRRAARCRRDRDRSEPWRRRRWPPASPGAPCSSASTPRLY